MVEMTTELHSNLLVLQKKSYQGNVLDFFLKMFLLETFRSNIFFPKLQEFSFKSSREEQKKS